MFEGLQKGKRIALFAGIVLGIFSIVLTKFDTAYKYIWLELLARCLFFASFLFVYLASFSREFVKNFIEKINLKIFLFVLLLTLISRFLFLQNYPFVSIGDELRDSGLNAQKIFTGEIKNVFGYGNYNGFGLGIPLFSSYFYRIFGSSVLTYRIPAALISVLDISLIYLLCVYLFNHKIAFWASMIMVSSWWHMYLSRTELVVILDSAITSLLLFSFFLLRRKRLLDFALMGTVLGFSMGFHASVKIFLILFPIIFFDLLLERNNNFKQKVEKILVIFLYFLVGFGPRILYGDVNVLFQKNKSFFFSHPNTSLQEISLRYGKSLLVWFYEPLQSRFPGKQPIFSPLLFVFFLAGFVSLFFIYRKKVKFLPLFYLFVFLIPLTNSALTDTLNFGHRLIPLLSISSIFCGVGIFFLLSKIRWKKIRITAAIFIFLYLITGTYNFFYKKPANFNNKTSDFLSMHLISFLKDNPTLVDRKTCLILSSENYYVFDLMHYREQYEYFFPNTQFERQLDNSLQDNEIYVFKDECKKIGLTTNFQEKNVLGYKLFKVDCNNRKNFYCPLEGTNGFKIYY